MREIQKTQISLEFYGLKSHKVDLGSWINCIHAGGGGTNQVLRRGEKEPEKEAIMVSQLEPYITFFFLQLLVRWIVTEEGGFSVGEA